MGILREQSATGSLAARPALDARIRELSAAQVEVADAKVGPLRDAEGVLQIWRTHYLAESRAPAELLNAAELRTRARLNRYGFVERMPDAEWEKLALGGR